MICNKCGRRLKEDNEKIMLEDFVLIKKEWGYFSKKDGTVTELVLCEACFDWLEGQMEIPVTRRKQIELL